MLILSPIPNYYIMCVCYCVGTIIMTVTVVVVVVIHRCRSPVLSTWAFFSTTAVCVVCTQIRPAGHRRQYHHLFALRAQYNNYTAARCVRCSFYYTAGNKNVFSVLLFFFFLNTLKRARNYISLFGWRRCRVRWWVGGKVTVERTVLAVVVTCMEAGPPLPPPP